VPRRRLLRPLDAASSPAAAPLSPSSAPKAHRRLLRPLGASALLSSSSSAADSVRTSLLEAIAPLDRGALASPADASRVDALARRFEQEFPPPPDAAAAATLLSGRWRLAYLSSKEVFRSSPFFDAFFQAVGNKEAAEAIFRFTGELPMASVGRAWQTIELSTATTVNNGGGAYNGGVLGGSGSGEPTTTTTATTIAAAASGRLVSEVELTVGALPFFPGLTGVVESTADVEGVERTAQTTDGSGALRLVMKMRQTRVTNSLFSSLGGDAVVAPVEKAFERLSGPESARVVYEVTALAGDLRVTRAPGTGLLMVHVRDDAAW
jgi:hypothetical protein